MYFYNLGLQACNYFIILSAVGSGIDYVLSDTLDKSDLEFSTRNQTDKWKLGLVKLMINYIPRYALDLLVSNSFELGTIQH